MAGELGFEPRFSESESDVLPLNYSPTSKGAIVLDRRSDGRAFTWGNFVDLTSPGAPVDQAARPGLVTTVTIASRLKAATSRKTIRGLP